MQDQILINNLRTLQYHFNGRDWSFTVGNRINSIGVEIDSIYLDKPHLIETGSERYIIEVYHAKHKSALPWRIVKFNKDGTVSVIELDLDV